MQINLRRNLTILMAAALMTVSPAATAFAAEATGPALESALKNQQKSEDTAETAVVDAAADTRSDIITTPDGRTARLAGEFKTTAYCYEDGGTSMTASGKQAQVDHTVSADLGVLPLGTEIYVDGQTYTVEDTGVHGNVVDIYLDSSESCVNYGVQYKNVYIIE